MSTKENQPINNQLLKIFTDMVTETSRLYNKLDKMMDEKSSNIDDTKQVLVSLNAYIEKITSQINNIGTNLSFNEQVILSKIKEELKELEKIHFIYMMLEAVDNMPASKKDNIDIKNIDIENVLDALITMIEENEEIEESEILSTSGIKVDAVDDGIILTIPRGKITVQGDIRNVKVDMVEDK